MSAAPLIPSVGPRAVLALAVDERLARHVADALSDHAVKLRQLGLRTPDGFPELLAVVTSAASRRQEEPEVAPDVQARDCALMTATRLLTYDEVCSQLNLSARQVQRLVKQGQLPAVRVSSNTVRVRMDDLAAYVDGLPVTVPTISRTAA